MAFEVTFELKESDLEHFRGVMRKAQAGAKQLTEQVILANAKKLIKDVEGNVPAFVSERIEKLETLIAMIEDSEWKIPEEERGDVLSALAYFSDPEDLVPDHIPVLGFLDDAIMIELVAEDLKDDIEAFDEFCAYRIREQDRSGDETITRDEWLDAKRRELHSRMRNRRSSRRGGGSSFRSIF
ncbi:YkvA family protein [Thalassotalea psychrophila]|uniref:YkvA family protein n=1 Tax=Thalassotalea psychrophila TaxID=3065647 RepID=A0ABY9TW56_9GAMM|nr:YkvA family protein [Colwelliaceae bacterium SQ149]